MKKQVFQNTLPGWKHLVLRFIFPNAVNVCMYLMYVTAYTHILK